MEICTHTEEVVVTYRHKSVSEEVEIYTHTEVAVVIYRHKLVLVVVVTCRHKPEKEVVEICNSMAWGSAWASHIPYKDSWVHRQTVPHREQLHIWS